MPAYATILDAVGRTPLVRINRMARHLDSTFYVKVEPMNPGGSVKDRIGMAMIEAAEHDGRLKPGGTIIEATAGNTGVGLALAAAVKGYRLIVVMPDKMSGDKIALLRAFGAEVVITPTSVPPDSPESYNGVADRLAREIRGAFRPDQFNNPFNPRAHVLTTGPEIWADTQGQVDVFVAGMGTGGTISGTGRYLKEKNPSLIVVGADPEGSILSGDSPKPFKVEGIGEDFIPRTFDRQIVDEMVRVSDKESFNTARQLARQEGILAGGSSGTALAAALKYAERLKRPHTFVVMLPDTGRNYLSKIFSDDWMQEHGFWEDRHQPQLTVGGILSAKRELPPLIALSGEDTVDHAVRLMQRHAISQLPVLDNERMTGSLNEATIMKLLHDGIDVGNQAVSAVMAAPFPSLDEKTSASEAYRLLLSGATAVMALREGRCLGLISRADLIHAWRTPRDTADTRETNPEGDRHAL